LLGPGFKKYKLITKPIRKIYNTREFLALLSRSPALENKFYIKTIFFFAVDGHQLTGVVKGHHSADA
jgi:hypothetical protein